MLECPQVWVATESGNLEVTYTHNEEHVSPLPVIHIYSFYHRALLSWKYKCKWLVHVCM